MTIGEALRMGADQLEGCLQSPRLESEFLLAAVLDRSRAQLLAHAEERLTPAEEARFQEWLELRRIDYPIQYLRGFEEFYGRRFRVNREVLIPRPETEILVELALERLAARKPPLRIADLGTGSGCIAVTLCCQLPDLRALAVDIHHPALQVAGANCCDWHCSDRVQLVCADLLSFLQPGPHLDLIVSNPPYVRGCNPAGLQNGVRDFEPRLALYGGDDGLDYYRRLFREAAPFLKEGAGMALEIGFDQEEGVRALAAASGWLTDRVRADLAGHPRCAFFSPAKIGDRTDGAGMS